MSRLIKDCKGAPGASKSQSNASVVKDLRRCANLFLVAGAAAAMLVPAPSVQLVVGGDGEVVLRPQTELPHLVQAADFFGLGWDVPRGPQLPVGVPAPSVNFPVSGDGGAMRPASVDILQAFQAEHLQRDEAAGHIGGNSQLPELVLAPAQDGAIFSQCQSVVLPTGYTNHVLQFGHFCYTQVVVIIEVVPEAQLALGSCPSHQKTALLGDHGGVSQSAAHLLEAGRQLLRDLQS